jgi:hypothetical protein
MKRERNRFPSDRAYELKVGDLDFGVNVVAGHFGGRVELRSTLSQHEETVWRVPNKEARQEVAELVESFGRQPSGTEFHDGTVVRLRAIRPRVVRDDTNNNRTELAGLRIFTQPTGYFDFLASNCLDGPPLEGRATYLRDIEDLNEAPFANPLALDITVVTADGWTPIAERADGMAVFSDCWETSCGETLQLPEDLDDVRGRSVSFDRAAYRALRDEGCLQQAEVDDLCITAVVFDRVVAAPSILMRAQTSIKMQELNKRILRRENPEAFEAKNEPVWINVADPQELVGSLSDRTWAPRAAASLVFAHALSAAESGSGLRSLDRASTGQGVGITLPPYRSVRDFLA